MGKDIKIKGMDKVTGADDEIRLSIFHPQSGVGVLQARHELRQGLYRQE